MGDRHLARPDASRPHHLAAGPDPSAAIRPSAAGRTPALDAAEILRLQRTAGNQSVVQLLGDDADRSPVRDVVGSGGAPLEPGLRRTMESAFGASFGEVRVHTDEQASSSAASVGASAYTAGNHIAFRSGQFDPTTAAGQRTIAHELAHVVQQRSGPVDGSPAAGGIRVSDPGDRFERAASAMADAVVSGEATGAEVQDAGGDAAGLGAARGG